MGGIHCPVRVQCKNKNNFPHITAVIIFHGCLSHVLLQRDNISMMTFREIRQNNISVVYRRGPQTAEGDTNWAHREQRVVQQLAGMTFKGNAALRHISTSLSFLSRISRLKCDVSIFEFAFLLCGVFSLIHHPVQKGKCLQIVDGNGCLGMKAILRHFLPSGWPGDTLKLCELF